MNPELSRDAVAERVGILSRTHNSFCSNPSNFAPRAVEKPRQTPAPPRNRRAILKGFALKNWDPSLSVQNSKTMRTRAAADCIAATQSARPILTAPTRRKHKSYELCRQKSSSRQNDKTPTPRSSRAPNSPPVRQGRSSIYTPCDTINAPNSFRTPHSAFRI